jgi:hypothetical protein
VDFYAAKFPDLLRHKKRIKLVRLFLGCIKIEKSEEYVECLKLYWHVICVLENFANDPCGQTIVIKVLEVIDRSICVPAINDPENKEFWEEPLKFGYSIVLRILIDFGHKGIKSPAIPASLPELPIFKCDSAPTLLSALGEQFMRNIDLAMKSACAHFPSEVTEYARAFWDIWLQHIEHAVQNPDDAYVPKLIKRTFRVLILVKEWYSSQSLAELWMNTIEKVVAILPDQEFLLNHEYSPVVNPDFIPITEMFGQMLKTSDMVELVDREKIVKLAELLIQKIMIQRGQLWLRSVRQCLHVMKTLKEIKRVPKARPVLRDIWVKLCEAITSKLDECRDVNESKGSDMSRFYTLETFLTFYVTGIMPYEFAGTSAETVAAWTALFDKFKIVAALGGDDTDVNTASHIVAGNLFRTFNIDVTNCELEDYSFAAFSSIVSKILKSSDFSIIRMKPERSSGKIFL